jgi:translation initiation factor 5A
MDVPNVRRTEYQLVSCSPSHFCKKKVPFAWLNGCTLKVNVDDGFLNLMTQDGTPKDDVKVPEGELGTQIQGGFDEGKDLLVTIVAAMGEEQVSSGIPRSGLDARL